MGLPGVILMLRLFITAESSLSFASITLVSMLVSKRLRCFVSSGGVISNRNGESTTGRLLPALTTVDSAFGAADFTLRAGFPRIGEDFLATVASLAFTGEMCSELICVNSLVDRSFPLALHFASRSDLARSVGSPSSFISLPKSPPNTSYNCIHKSRHALRPIISFSRSSNKAPTSFQPARPSAV